MKLRRLTPMREGFYADTDEGDNQREEDIKKADAMFERFFERELNDGLMAIRYDGFVYDSIFITVMGCGICLKRKLGKLGKRIGFEVTFDFNTCDISSAVVVGHALDKLLTAANKGKLDAILAFIDERELKY